MHYLKRLRLFSILQYITAQNQMKNLNNLNISQKEGGASAQCGEQVVVRAVMLSSMQTGFVHCKSKCLTLANY